MEEHRPKKLLDQDRDAMRLRAPAAPWIGLYLASLCHGWLCLSTTRDCISSVPSDTGSGAPAGALGQAASRRLRLLGSHITIVPPSKPHSTLSPTQPENPARWLEAGGLS